MSLRIGAVPDRTPVKLTLSLSPETYASLSDYAAIHRREFGSETPVADLAALMIEKFLVSDAAFRRARKSLRQPQAAKE